jgi:hypothetical protein
MNTAIAAGNQEWSFFVANGDRFVISKGGSGLEEAALDDSGNLVIEGTLTTGSSTVYPDYVFESDYPLMSLDELSAFIAEHKHLPNVPSSEEVEGGRRINMTELQMKVLEKVEELTIYTLEQHEIIRSQEGKLRSQYDTIRLLQERLSALEQGL